METQFLNEAEKFPNGELASMKEEIRTWQEKYSRLCEAHKRVQKVNQNLEDKLLKIVDKCETEKGAFTKDIATLSHRLADANYTIHRLSQDNAKYRNDVNLAIQLLQCKPSNFVGQKYDSLPTEVQAKVRNYVNQKRRPRDQSPDVKSITVPISTFPPTAMVYNITKSSTDKYSDDESDDGKPPVDMVSAAIMAKVLEDRERERIFAKHCDTCVCHKSILMVDSETQTSFSPEHTSKIYPSGLISDFSKIDETINQTLNKTGVCAKINQTLPTQTKIERQSKASITKIKQIKTKKGECWSESDIKVNPQFSDTAFHSEVNPTEIINDRIWKNTWTKSKFITSTHDDKKESNRKNDTQLDVINERVWKMENGNINNLNQVTLIEVTNAVNANHQSPDSAASPSFSNDSVVISSSEPSSSSSDLVQSINEKRRMVNNNLTVKDRLSGPRNCLIKVREGSKNILLDNVGQYQTVLYTSSGSGSGSANQTNTALVHNLAKSTTSGRSLSTSSDEAFPILPNDATQLQRVAEWVQSSVGNSGKMSSNLRNVVSSAGINSQSSTKTKKPSCTLIEMPTDDQNDLINENVPLTSTLNLNITSPKMNEQSTINVENTSIEMNVKPEGEIKDLISFDSNTEDDGDDEKNNVQQKDSAYEIKITKEMEETYLKLAASLDPVSLRLATNVNADLTIEKYRKDHKKTQKAFEKSGAAT
ncbi:uncharacterized protein [Chelonus insularis]|nr:uncharacterized protein LOC118065182 isoform X2 [Chelonus insularis]XP_034936228.1 uncharacterized protein LOC118065182 isoform X2 [Chelonus insularis]